MEIHLAKKSTIHVLVPFGALLEVCLIEWMIHQARADFILTLLDMFRRSSMAHSVGVCYVATFKQFYMGRSSFYDGNGDPAI